MQNDDLHIYDHYFARNTTQLLTNRLTHCIEIVNRWMSIVKQPTKVESIKDENYLVGIDTSSDKMHFNDRQPVKFIADGGRNAVELRNPKISFAAEFKTD